MSGKTTRKGGTYKKKGSKTAGAAFRALGLAVALMVCLALVLPGSADEYVCGLDEHEHGEGCYAGEGGEFATPSSMDAHGELICGMEEHVHGEGCLAGGPSRGVGDTGDTPGEFDIMALDGALSTTDQWDLNNFTTGVVVKDGTGAVVPPGGEVTIGAEYTLSISFKEKSNMQFAYHDDGLLHYQLPANIIIDAALTNQPIYGVGTPKPVIGRYSVTTDGHISVFFYDVWESGAEAPGNFIDVYTNAQFTIDILASCGGTGGNQSFDFGNGVVVDMELEEPVGAPKIVKSAAAYDPATRTVGYTVTITAEGGDVIIDRFSDYMQVGSANLGSGQITITDVKVDGAAAGFAWRGGSNPPTWDVEISPARTLAKGQSMTVTYTVDFSNYITSVYGANAAYRNYGFTAKNTATVRYTTPKDSVPKTRTANMDVEVKHTVIDKTGSYDSSNNRITWQISVGDGVVPLGGYVITDAHGPGVTMPANVTLTLRDQNNAALSPTITVPTTASGFTYTVPATHGSPAKAVYYVTASYNTNIDNATKPSNGEIKNNIGINLPGNPGTEATVSTGGVGFDFKKYAGWADEDTIRWTIVFTVPEGMYGQRIRLEDWSGEITNRPRNMTVTLNGAPIAQRTAPLGWYYFEYEFEYEWPTGWGMYFNNATSDRYSIWPLAEQATIVISYEISLSAEIIEPDYYDGYDVIGEFIKADPDYCAVNSAGLYGLNSVEYANSYVTFHWPVFKTNTSSAVSGDDMVFTYQVILNGFEDWHDHTTSTASYWPQIFKEGGPAEFFDEFDERLEFVPGSFSVELRDDDFWEEGSSQIIKTYRYPSGQDATINGSTLTVYLEDLRLSTGGNPGTTNDENWYAQTEYFMVARYRLRLRGGADVNDQYILKNTAGFIGNGDRQYEAVSGRFTSECTVTYGKKAVDKSMDANGKVATFSILVNPDGKKFATPPDVNLLVTDSMSNTLSFYLTSIEVFTETVKGNGVFTVRHTVTQTASTDAEAAWTWALTGENEITLVIPDETPVKIVYEALIRGGTGDSVRIDNYVEVTGGYHDEYEEVFKLIDTTASGGGSRSELLLYKVDGMNHSRFLPGAQFALYIGWPTGDGWNYGNSASTPIPAQYTAPGGGKPQTFEVGGMTFYYLGEGTTAGANGSIEFDDPWITPSHEAVYAVAETAAPPGYVQPVALPGLGSVTLFSYEPHGDIGGKPVEPVTDNIMIANDSQSISATINGGKEIAGRIPEGESAPTFTFNLLQVTDSTGLYPVIPFVRATDTVTGEGAFSFSVHDLRVGRYYYMITESPNPSPGGYWEYDDAAFIVRVDVFVGQGGTLGYDVTILSGPGDELVFTNTSTYEPPSGSLVVSKVVEDEEDDGVFEFTVTYEGEPVDLTAEGITVAKVGETGTYAGTDPEHGTFTMTRDTVVKIDGLAPGTYTVTEAASGYETTFIIGGGDSEEGASATVEVEDGGEASVVFTNVKAEEPPVTRPILPETGGVGAALFVLAGSALMATGLTLIAAASRCLKRSKY